MSVAQFFLYVNTIGIPIIVVVGVVGNTISFVVFVTTHLRFKSASVYLAFMNITDTGFLLSLVPVWLGWVDIHIFNTNGRFAKFIYELLHMKLILDISKLYIELH